VAPAQVWARLLHDGISLSSISTMYRLWRSSARTGNHDGSAPIPLYRPAFPGRFGSIEHARAVCALFVDHYNHVHCHAGIGLHTPRSVHYDTAGEIRAQRTVTRRCVRRQPDAIPASGRQTLR